MAVVLPNPGASLVSVFAARFPAPFSFFKSYGLKEFKNG
jgi:hypothetical protein